MPRRRTVPSKIQDMIKCTKDGCVSYAELESCDPKEGGGMICYYRCKRCNTKIERSYKI